MTTTLDPISISPRYDVSARDSSELIDDYMGKEFEKEKKKAGGKVTDYYQPLVDGDVLESTDQQKMMVAASVASSLTLAAKAAIFLPHTTAGYVGAASAFLLGYEFADFGSGVYHWSLDNYGSAKTPILGP